MPGALQSFALVLFGLLFLYPLPVLGVVAVLPGIGGTGGQHQAGKKGESQNEQDQSLHKHNFAKESFFTKKGIRYLFTGV